MRWSLIVIAALGGCFGGGRDDGPDARPALDAAADASPDPIDAIDAGPVPCPASYTRDDQTGSCYRFLDPGTPQSWLLAEATCELDSSQGVTAHLVVIDDGNEAARVLARAGGTGLWIGVSDHDAEGTFRPVTDAPLGATPWAAGEPDNAGNREDCAGYLPGASSWSDRPCGEELPVVCELDGRRVAAPASYCDTDAPTDCGSCGAACDPGDPCVAQVCIVPPPTCPTGYVQNTDAAIGTCHKLVTTPASWQAAELDCEDDLFAGTGSHLAVVESAAERDYLAGLALGSFWIGASDHAIEGRFVWVTGAPVVFPDWIAGEPNDDFNTEDCAEYRASSLRNDRTCSVNQRYVCEWDGTPAAAARTWCDADAVTDCGACGNACAGAQTCVGQYCQAACPPGYTGAIGSCYRIGTTTAQTWQASEASCEADVAGGIPAHLAVVGSEDERVWLDAQISGSFWIGLSDHRVDGTFRWVTGAPLGAFTNWGSGEPNNGANTEDCVEYRETTDRWNDRTCSAPSSWACEWDGVAPAATPTWCDTDTHDDCGVCGHACLPVLQQCVAQTCQAS